MVNNPNGGEMMTDITNEAITDKDQGLLKNIRYGWRCPLCQSIYSPSVHECIKCNKPDMRGAAGNYRLFEKSSAMARAYIEKCKHLDMYKKYLGDTNGKLQDYCQKNNLGIVGDNVVDIVIAETERLTKENNYLKEQLEKAEGQWYREH